MKKETPPGIKGQRYAVSTPLTLDLRSARQMRISIAAAAGKQLCSECVEGWMVAYSIKKPSCERVRESARERGNEG